MRTATLPELRVFQWTYASPELRATLLRTARSAAENSLSMYPQYVGHFADYVLVEVKRDVRTKMGLAFTRGTLALARPSVRRLPNGREYATVFSWRNVVDTSVPLRDVRFLEGTPASVEEVAA